MTKQMETLLRISAIAGAGLLFIRAAQKRAPANLLLAGLASALLRAGISARRVTPRAAETDDIVDLGSELSFPASDPPAY